MGYLNFAEFDGSQALEPTGPFQAPASVSVGSARASASFSALEWSVIALARRERLSSLRQPGRIAVALGSLFGLRRNSRLADDRLEALRRMAVLAWHKSYVIPSLELQAFFAAGFSPDHYETLLRSISRGRGKDAKQPA